MLSPQHVKPFLMHEDSDVRRAAIMFLREFNDRAIASADDIWPIIDRYGAGEHGSLLNILAAFPQTPASVERALHDREILDGLGSLERLIAHLDLPLLQRFWDQISESDALWPFPKRQAEERLRLSEQPAETVWDGINAAIELARREGWSEELESTQKMLAEAAGRFPLELGERVSSLLQLESEPGETAWEIAAAASGAMKRADAIDSLLDEIISEDDMVRESALDALDAYKNQDLVGAIERSLAGSSAVFRNAASDLLGKIRLVSAEQLLARMFREEPDSETRSFIANALIDQLTDDADMQARLRDLAERRDYDDDWVDFRNALVPFAAITGMDLPQAEQWRREEPQRRAERRARRAQAMNIPAMDNPSMRNWDEPEASASTIIRENPKIGRNDPCPCGSGKKYKKCCLGKDQR